MQTVIHGPFAIAHFADQNRLDKRHASSVTCGNQVTKRRLVAAQEWYNPLEVGQGTFSEAGTTPLGKMQPTDSRDTHEQFTDATATSAFPGAPATADDFLGFPVFVFNPRRRAPTLLTAGVTPLGNQALPTLLAGVIEHFGAVSGKKLK